jgi:flagellar biosynthesis component FlhA
MVSVSANVVVVVVVELVTAMVVAPMHVHATFVVSTAAQIPAEAISVMAFVATMAFVGVTTNTIQEKEKETEKEEKEREYRKKRMEEKEEERRKRINEIRTWKRSLPLQVMPSLPKSSRCV